MKKLIMIYRKIIKIHHKFQIIRRGINLPQPMVKLDDFDVENSVWPRRIN